MTVWLQAVLPWVLPPLVGAIIGYVTNDIAIRMLFRPLLEKRVFGIPVPFTPGIIPKQRTELAASIGRMVSRELINAETLRKQITSPAFTDSLERSVSGFTESLLDTRLDDLKPGQDNPLSRSLLSILSSAVSGFIGSDVFLEAVDEAVGAAVRTLYRQPISVFLPAPGEREAFVRSLLDSIAFGSVRDTISRGISEFLEAELGRDRPLRHLVPAEVTRDLEASLRRFYPKAFDGTLEWLRLKSTRMELEIRGRFLLRDILAKLNAFQRMIVNAGQYDRRLSEKMPEIVDDIIASIQQSGSKPENIRRVTFSVGRFIRKWLQKTPSEVEKELGIDLRAKLASVTGSLLDRLGDPGTADALAARILAFLEEHEETTVSELSRSLFGIDEEGLTRRITAMVDAWRTRRNPDKLLPPDILRLVSEFFRSRRHLRIRELIGFDEERKREVDGFVVERIQSVLVDRLPEIVESIDVEKLVVDKINGLDVESVEKLLLMVIAKHLKWINLFGAILGALIGFLQVLLGNFV